MDVNWIVERLYHGLWAPIRDVELLGEPIAVFCNHHDALREADLYQDAWETRVRAVSAVSYPSNQKHK